jgi:hypothetical protein
VKKRSLHEGPQRAIMTSRGPHVQKQAFVGAFHRLHEDWEGLRGPFVKKAPSLKPPRDFREWGTPSCRNFRMVMNRESPHEGFQRIVVKKPHSWRSFGALIKTEAVTKAFSEYHEGVRKL